MQTVTTEYVESMKQIGRNRGYIKITLGVINQKAQDNLRLTDDTDLVYFSTNSILDGDTVSSPYATCEENWSKVDGSMYFAPKEDASSFYTNGLVSKNILGGFKFDFENGESYDVSGFTIDFSDNYPVDFIISNGTEFIEFKDNDKRYFTSDMGLHGISELFIYATKMLYDNNRLRIFSLSLGVSNTFNNETTLGYYETTYVSPIADTLPSIDTNITVCNYDQYYNPDNEQSVLAFFEVGQEVRVQFGYDTNNDGNIEWLPETLTHLKSWSATDKDATFTTTDIFDYISGTYNKGRIYDEGITLYDLAVDVCEDGGITDYKLDSCLKKITVKNPMPVVSHTQALQIIANAGRCSIREDRDGKIYLESSFIPNYVATSNGETEYSNVANVVKDTDKIAYAISSKGFSLLSDENLLFMGEPNLEKVGYVSDVLADDNGFFVENPIITLTVESDYSPFALTARFRNVAPQEFIIRTYRESVLVEEIPIKNPNVAFNLSHTFEEFSVMTVEFTKGQPNSRITIDKLMFGAPTDYTIYRNMMMVSPRATRQDRIKSMVVSMQSYLENENFRTLASPTIKNAKDGEYTFNITYASYGYEITSNEEDAEIEVIDSGAYFVSVRLSNVTTDTIKLTIKGYMYDVDEQFLTVEHNTTGIEKAWNNPLISDIDHAILIENWLANYFLGDVEYEFDWRGDPRVDAGDLFFLELKTGEKVNIRGFQTSINFNGAWSGSMKARKVIV